jgi:hypothetical protein
MKQLRHIPLMGKRQSLFLILASLAILALTGCSDASPTFGQFFSGRTLVISVVGIERVPELRYTAVADEDPPIYVLLAPTQDDLELVVVHLKVQNHTATSALLNIDRQAAELRDMLSNKYFPIDVGAVGQLIDAPRDRAEAEQQIFDLKEEYTAGNISEKEWSESTADAQRAADAYRRSEQVLELEADGTFPPTKGFLRGPVELQRGMGLDGWMVFEAPPETKFREFKWRAGDNLTISF